MEFLRDERAMRTGGVRGFETSGFLEFGIFGIRRLEAF